MLGIPESQTRQRKEKRAALGGGTTAKLGGGPTARGTGGRGTKRITTMGGTTSQSRKGEDEDIEWDDDRQCYFNIKPNALFVIKSSIKEDATETMLQGDDSKAEEG